MSSFNITAALVDAGPGLPPVYKCVNLSGPQWLSGLVPMAEMDTTDKTTRDGLLCQLAKWAGDNGEGVYFLCWDYEGLTCLMRSAGWLVPEVLHRFPKNLTLVATLTAIGNGELTNPSEAE